MVRTGIVPNPFLCLPAFCWLGFCFVCVVVVGILFCVCVCVVVVCLFETGSYCIVLAGLKLPPRTRTHRSLPVSASQVWVTTPGGDCKVCLFNYICLFIECIGWAGTCSDAYVEVGTTYRSQFSSAMWVPGIEFRVPALAASTFTCWVILLVPHSAFITITKTCFHLFL